MDVGQGKVMVDPGYRQRQEMAKASASQPYAQPTLRERLQAQLVQAEERVEALHKAIAALDATPQSEALLDALGKVGIG